LPFIKRKLFNCQIEGTTQSGDQAIIIMSLIALPKKIEINKGEQQNQGYVVIEPCYPGYGITFGNALRRVLLSSLPGAAVVGVKIKGASHEFMSLPHVKEDILEIILNLKYLRMKIYGEEDEVVKLELDVHGEKEVTAADIKSTSAAEIMNPELKIASITDMAGNLQMEIYVARGKGYETIESREKKNAEIGYIEMDSIFSPVLNVGLNIDNVRVGKMTNWDRLTVDILTDGTITPEEAFTQSVNVLIEQFGALLKKEDSEEAEIMPAEIESEEAGTEEMEADDGGMMEEAKDEVKKKRGRPKKS
jgi:DNA-directed RNA polymerase subunit alpha